MNLLKSGKWKLTFKVLPIVLAIILAKLIAHYYNLEFLTLNSLFGAIISANVFLIGFLISGVLVDYKESEKLPGELSCSLEVIADECEIVYKSKKPKIAKDLLGHIHNLTNQIINWFYKKEKTRNLHVSITALNDYFLALEPLTQANFIVRLKNEQNNLRRNITRIHTVRETSFNPLGYAIAEIISGILCLGLIFTNINPYYESIFFVAFVSFILLYMILLIRDLDNPFEYNEIDHMLDEVSLKPLIDLEKRLTDSLNDK